MSVAKYTTTVSGLSSYLWWSEGWNPGAEEVKISGETLETKLCLLLKSDYL